MSTESALSNQGDDFLTEKPIEEKVISIESDGPKEGPYDRTETVEEVKNAATCILGK